MFEKEAEEYCARQVLLEDVRDNICNAFQDGAEFGYNKANEWHYPSKGEYPKEYEDILIYFLTEDGMKDWTRGWYENDKHIFKYLSALGTQYLKTVIAWKEIVLPELKED